ncbi:9140_t:CDS:1, partial [Funneliformis geosporum]
SIIQENYAGPPYMTEFDSSTGYKLYHIAMLFASVLINYHPLQVFEKKA